MGAKTGGSLRAWGITLLSVLLSLFVLYTCATGPFESIIQRAIFLAILICLGVLYYPLWGDTRMRPAGIVIDACMVVVSIVACSYVIINYEMIIFRQDAIVHHQIGKEHGVVGYDEVRFGQGFQHLHAKAFLMMLA